MSITSVDGGRVEQIRSVWWESDPTNGHRMPLATISDVGDGGVQVVLNAYHPMMTKMQKGAGSYFPPVIIRKLIADALRLALRSDDVPDRLTAVQVDELVNRFIGTQKLLNELVIHLTDSDK